MIEYITQANFSPLEPFKGKKGSSTIPNQSISIQDMFLQASKGLLPDIVNYDNGLELSEDDWTTDPQDLTELDSVLTTVQPFSGPNLFSELEDKPDPTAPSVGSAESGEQTS